MAHNNLTAYMPSKQTSTMQPRTVKGVPVTLTIPEVAELTHCCRSWVEKRIYDGTFKAYRLGRRKVLIDAGSVADYYSKHSTEAMRGM